MIRDLILSLVSFFVVEPLQAELADKLAAARVPQAIVAQVSECATAATPRLADRALSDPWWGVTTTIEVWGRHDLPGSRPRRRRTLLRAGPPGRATVPGRCARLIVIGCGGASRPSMRAALPLGLSKDRAS